MKTSDIFIWVLMSQVSSRERRVPPIPGFRPANPGKAACELVRETRNLARRTLSIFHDEESRKLKKGDIIGICRGFYDHYGVYADDSSVIHYSSRESDTSSENAIIETSLEDFMRGDDTLFRLWFPPVHLPPIKIATACAAVARPHLPAIFGLKDDPAYRLRGPEETIRRARSRLGEKAYSLPVNNCEHFAIWCKTGLSESHQVNAFLLAIRPIINPAGT